MLYFKSEEKPRSSVIVLFMNLLTSCFKESGDLRTVSPRIAVGSDTDTRNAGWSTAAWLCCQDSLVLWREVEENHPRETCGR